MKLLTRQEAPRKVHAVYRLLLLAPSDVRELDLEVLQISSLAIAGAALRGEYPKNFPDWAKMARVKPSEEVMAWVRATALARDWVFGPDFLVSPKGWPEAIEHQLGTITPWEVAAAWDNVRAGPLKHPCLDSFIGYAFGMSLELLAKLKSTTKGKILKEMRAATNYLWDQPSWVLWATNVDIRCAPMDSDGDRSFVERLEEHARVVDTHPLALNSLRWLKGDTRLHEALRSAMLPRRLQRRLLANNIWVTRG